MVSTITKQSDYGTLNWEAETTAAGSQETSGDMADIGPQIRFSATRGRAKNITPTAGGIDIRETSFAGGKIGSTTYVWKVTSLTFLHYLTNLPGTVGAGDTVADPVTLACTFDELGTDKYFVGEYAIPGFCLISSGRDLDLVGMAVFNHKYPQYIAKATYEAARAAVAADAGPSTEPCYRFSTGGTNPVTWDSDALNVYRIRLMVNWNPIVETSPGGGDLNTNMVTARRIRFAVDVGQNSVAYLLKADYDSGEVKDLAWTMHTSAGNDTCTLTGCALDPITDEVLTAEVSPNVPLSLSGEAVSLAWA